MLILIISQNPWSLCPSIHTNNVWHFYCYIFCSILFVLHTVTTPYKQLCSSYGHWSRHNYFVLSEDRIGTRNLRLTVVLSFRLIRCCMISRQSTMPDVTINMWRMNISRRSKFLSVMLIIPWRCTDIVAFSIYFKCAWTVSSNDAYKCGCSDFYHWLTTFSRDHIRLKPTH